MEFGDLVRALQEQMEYREKQDQTCAICRYSEEPQPEIFYCNFNRAIGFGVKGTATCKFWESRADISDDPAEDSSGRTTTELDKPIGPDEINTIPQVDLIEKDKSNV